MNIPIVYEDDSLIVADKPSGLLTVPTPRRESRTLTGILNDDARSRGITQRIYPCHRLDREVSGLIIYAKGKSALEKMEAAFRRRAVAKRYLAFAHGSVRPQQGRITLPIEGKPSRTAYRLLEDRAAFSVLEVMPETGRTNQIRIHFKGIGHPLVGESRFAFRKDFALRAKRVCLHAASLEFPHPLTGRTIRLESPLPKDMETFLKTHPASSR